MEKSLEVYSLSRVDLNFTSLLVVQISINSTLEGRTVACVHNNGSHETTVGMHTITYTTGKVFSTRNTRLIQCVYIY